MPLHYTLMALLVLLCYMPQSYAKDKDDEPAEISIIQERLFDKKREVGLTLGYYPDDNFYEVYPITFNFVNHFNERYAWEVIRASYMINKENDLKKDLENNFGVTPSTFDEMTSHFETAFIFKPTYGKDAFLNKHIINHEGYMSFGVGVANFERQVSYGSPNTESAPTASIGIGRKYFINKSFNISLDLKSMLIFKENNTENYVYLGVGFNYRFDLFGSMHKERAKDTSIYEYIE